MILFDKVTKKYPGTARPALDSIDLNIERGEFVFLVGASGSGKSSCLRMMIKEDKPTRGQIHVLGQDLATVSSRKVPYFRRKLGVVFQDFRLLPNKTVFDNVAFPLREHTPLSEALIRDIVLMKLDAVGLRGARDLMPSQISGGMSRRVALARAIALDPELIMYDEPFAGLDPISLGTAARLIRRLNDSLGVTSVVVSHDVDETLAIADHVVILANGKVAVQGSPEEVRACTDPLIHQFVNALSEGPVPFHYPGLSVHDDYGVSV